MRKLTQITIMNALLCLFVVMIHLTFTPLVELMPKSLPHIFIFTVNKALGFCVPAFIFLSGLKLFNRYKNGMADVKPFLKRRFTKIVIPYFFAVIIYTTYFGAKGWLNDSLFDCMILGTVSSHFYYIVVMIQLYLLFPLIYRLFTRNSQTVLIISALITLFCILFLNSGYWDRFFGTYIFYFVLGMTWSKYDLYAVFEKRFGVIGTTLAVTLIFHICRLYMHEYMNVSYRLFPILNMLYSILAIIVLYAVSEEWLKRSKAVVSASRVLEKCTYSIYLYHCLGIFVLKYDVLSKYSLSVKGEFLITSAVIYSLISVLCAYSYFLKRRKKT